MNVCSHNMYVSPNVGMLNICDKLSDEMLINVIKFYFLSKVTHFKMLLNELVTLLKIG